MANVNERYCSVRQAAEYLGLSKSALDQMIRIGTIKAEAVDTVRLLRWADVRAYGRKPNRVVGRNKKSLTTE